MIRYAIATWNGPGLTGEGRLTSESNLLDEVPFTFGTRFGEQTTGTNPEELLAAAHASCFIMKLRFVLEEAGFNPVSLRTTACISFVNGAINGSNLIVRANIPGMSAQLFEENVEEASRCCPVSRALNIEITIEARLEY